MKQGKRNSTYLQGFCVSLIGLKHSTPTLKYAYIKQQDNDEKTNIQNLLNITKQ